MLRHNLSFLEIHIPTLTFLFKDNYVRETLNTIHLSRNSSGLFSNNLSWQFALNTINQSVSVEIFVSSIYLNYHDFVILMLIHFPITLFSSYCSDLQVLHT